MPSDAVGGIYESVFGFGKGVCRDGKIKQAWMMSVLAIGVRGGSLYFHRSVTSLGVVRLDKHAGILKQRISMRKPMNSKKSGFLRIHCSFS